MNFDFHLDHLFNLIDNMNRIDLLEYFFETFSKARPLTKEAGFSRVFPGFPPACHDDIPNSITQHADVEIYGISPAKFADCLNHNGPG